MTKEQAQAFLNTLWPSGDNAHLASHTRTYFEALMGTVPFQLDGYGQADMRAHFASLLREIADHLQSSRDLSTQEQTA